MNFREALKLMKEGKKVKLPSWSGYWCWNVEKNTVEMHCRKKDSDAGKEVLDIRETKRVKYTLDNICSDEWILADEENTPVLGGESTFDFGSAIKYLKRGLKVARKNWNGTGMFLYYVPAAMYRPYTEVAQSLVNKNGLVEYGAYIAITTTQGNIIPWSASQTDMLAEDWIFVESEEQ